MRQFRDQKIELLAPAGNFEIFKAIVETGCDAIYFGGQRMNMRMIRKGFNFSDEELKEAILLANEKGKATYITVNNLLDHEEVGALDEYLAYLSNIKPTGIIVQDMAVLNRIEKNHFDLEVHASVMMNVHNLQMIHVLEKKGVKRVVLSRETTLAEARYFKDHSDMALEYFTHGDMCVTHGAQCTTSAMLFGMSSNRGKCLKPCRWWFDYEGKRAFPLAVKDMSMITHLPEMIHAGITSYKIEGRMREKEFITQLINQYAQVFDRYIEDPVAYDYHDAEAWVFVNRKRDLSTAFAFGNPGAENINSRYEGTGKFYSTGKMFSTPTPERIMDSEQLKAISQVFGENVSGAKTLSVRVEDMPQAFSAIEEGVDRIILSADVFEPKKVFSVSDIKTLAKKKGNAELFISTPRMMDDLKITQYASYLEKLIDDIDGVLISNLGALHAFKDLPVRVKRIMDASANIHNHEAALFYYGLGSDLVTPSVELPAQALKAFLDNADKTEIITFGRLTTMYMAHDLFKAHEHPVDQPFILHNEGGEYEVKRDVHGKCHLLMQNAFTLMPFINQLNAKSVRIEAQTLPAEILKQIIRLHKRIMASTDMTPYDVTHMIQVEMPSLNLTFGATRF